MASHESFAAPVAEYVLGVLEPDEERAFEEHLSACPLCQQAVSEFREVAADLAGTAELVQPPSSLKDRILTAARVESSGNSTIRDASTTAKARTRARVSFATKALSGVAAILIFALAGLGLQVFLLGQRTARDAALMSRSYTALSIMARADERWQISGTSLLPTAHGVLAYSKEDQAASLIIWGLPYEHDERYRVSTTAGETQTSVGTMWPEDDGLWIVIPQDLGNGDRISVTLVQSNSRNVPPVDVVDVALSDHNQSGH